jgi:hypothetical protein
MTMRAAMKWQAEPQGRAVRAGQQQPVAAKVIKADTLAAQSIEQGSEATRREQLPREQVVTLHARLVTGMGGTVDRAERQALACRAALTHR